VLVVAKGASDIADRLHQRVVGHHHAGADTLDRAALCDHLAGLFGERA
jgi:hypothetical protein